MSSTEQFITDKLSIVYDYGDQVFVIKLGQDRLPLSLPEAVEAADFINDMVTETDEISAEEVEPMPLESNSCKQYNKDYHYCQGQCGNICDCGTNESDCQLCTRCYLG